MPQPTPWERQLAGESYSDLLKTVRITDRELAAILRDGAREAERVVERTLAKPGIGAELRRQQYTTAAEVLRRQQADLWGQISKSTVAGIDRASRDAARAHERHTEFLARAAVAEGLPDLPDIAPAMRAAAENAAENIRSRYRNAIDLSPRVYRNADLAAGRIDRIVNRGIATQKSAREIAADVRGLIRPDTRGGVSYAAMRLGRTELNNAFHATTVRSNADAPFIEGMKWTLSGSHPRPDECDSLASRGSGLGPGVYRPTDVPPKPHPQCLCFTVSISTSNRRFRDGLRSGEYDDWLRANGQAPLGESFTT